MAKKLKRHSPTSKTKIDRPLWNKLLKAFRDLGQNYVAVGKACKVNQGTAKKAYVEGWHTKPGMEFAIPIRERLDQEKVRARAALARENNELQKDHRIASQKSLKEAIDDGFQDLVESRAKQGRVVRAARDNSFAALVVASKLLKASVPLADKITEQLDTQDLPVKERLAALRAVSRFTKDAMDIAQIADEMERRALGEPDTILQVQHGVTMNIEEAKEALSDVADLLEVYGEEGIDGILDVEADWAESDEEEGLLIKDEDEDQTETEDKRVVPTDDQDSVQ